MPKRFFITGTDTNVGKTVLSALLCAALDATYWKPIQTGAIEGTDRKTVMRLAGLVAERALAEVYCFDPPVSPHLASQKAGVEIDISLITAPTLHNNAGLIVEGAGGVLVPINSSQFMADLMRHISLPVILATRSTLGTINHTLLSLRALHGAGIEVTGVVMIGPEDADNRSAIEKYGNVQVIGCIPHLAHIDRKALLDVYHSKFDTRVFAS